MRTEKLQNKSFSLRKIPLFHLISWCENFVEKHSFYKRKLDEIAVFFAVFTKEKVLVNCSY